MSSQVIVAGWIDWDPAQREEVLTLFQAVAKASRAEEGCIDYYASPDLEAPGRVRVFEHWHDEQALRDHLGLSHVQEFREAVSGLTRTGRSISLHVLASSGPMTSTPPRSDS
jgi:quinol monooxygenase YgiN